MYACAELWLELDHESGESYVRDFTCAYDCDAFMLGTCILCVHMCVCVCVYDCV